MKFGILVLLALGLFESGCTEPYQFPVTSCNDCRFKLGELESTLKCVNQNQQTFCSCEFQPIADSRLEYWEMKGQDGADNCTVSKFGPCGEVNGIKIDCNKGLGLECNKDKYCVDPKSPESDENGFCAFKKHCKANSMLTCNRATHKCIKSKSTPDGKECAENEDCANENCVVPALPFAPSICGNGSSTDGSNGDGSTGHLFPVSSCNACGFNLGELKVELTCVNQTFCSCKHNPPADSRPEYWKIKGQDGADNCTVSKFGPCGEQNGIKIDCSKGLECNKDKYCIDPQNPESDENGLCGSKKHCKNDKGLTCNRATYKCIKSKSTPEGEDCAENEDCKSENCARDENDTFPFGPAKCNNNVSTTESDFSKNGGYSIGANFCFVLISLLY